MHPTKLVITGLFCFLLALRGLGAQAVEAPPPAQFSIAPQEDGWIALGDLLRHFEEVAGQTLALDEETGRLVEQVKLFASGPIAAEPEAVVPVVESVLAGFDYFWTVVREEPPGILALRSLQTTARGRAREGACFVPVEELARYAEYPARLLQVIVSLPRSDVRTISNSLRSIVVDPNVLQLIPIGGSELLIQGNGRAVSDLVAMLREVDRQGAPEATEASGASHPLPLPTAEGSYTLGAETEGGSSLLALVVEYARATGQVALVNEETHRLLEQIPVPLSKPLTVAGADFPTLCEELLRESAFVIGELHRGTPRLFTVRSLDTTARGTARQDARYVDPSSLADCAKRPATLFATVVHAPHTDVRTLSNSMRSIVIDPNLLQLIPVGNSNSLMLQARGRELVDLAAMLHAIDAAAAAAPAVPTPPAAGVKGDEGEGEDG